MNDADRDKPMPVELVVNGTVISCVEPNNVCANHAAKTAQQSNSNLAEITAGQIKVSIFVSLAGLAVSTLFAIALISVWTWHSFHGSAMPDVPWFIISVVMVPFGSAIVMKIPKRVDYRIEDE